MSDSLISRIFWGVVEKKQTIFYQKNQPNIWEKAEINII